MKRTILLYGGASGAFIIGTAILSLALSGAESTHLSALEWLGYLVMILALSVIFVGIKRYRDEERGGVIRFGQAFLVGLGITAVASVIYVIGWEINLALTDYAFMDQYAASLIEAKAAAGANAAELEALVAEMARTKEQYANPLFRVPITLLEIFPVGLLVSLIAAAVLRTRGGASTPVLA
jgi:hypothetical protein